MRITLFVLFSLASLAQAQLRLTRIDTINIHVSITNFGTMTVDASTHYIDSNGASTRLDDATNVTPVAGSPPINAIPPGGTFVGDFNLFVDQNPAAFALTGDELALYSSNAFDNAANMVDYLMYCGQTMCNNFPRLNLAVTRMFWASMTFIDLVTPSIATFVGSPTQRGVAFWRASDNPVTSLPTMAPTTAAPTVATASPTVATAAPTVATASPTVATASPTVANATTAPTPVPGANATTAPTPVPGANVTTAPTPVPGGNATSSPTPAPGMVAPRGSNVFKFSCGTNGCAQNTKWYVSGGITNRAPEENPVIYVERGSSYVFINENTSIPLAVHFGSTDLSVVDRYFSGVTGNGISNGNLTWNVMTRGILPDRLYYRSEDHEPMVGTIEKGDAVLEPYQEVVVPASQAIGAVSCSVDSSGTTPVLGVNIRWSGILSTVTKVHLHMGPPGSNGPVLRDLGVLYGTSSPLLATEIAINSTEATLLQTPNSVYINVHSVNFPDGELRAAVTCRSGTLETSFSSASALTLSTLVSLVFFLLL